MAGLHLIPAPGTTRYRSYIRTRESLRSFASFAAVLALLFGLLLGLIPMWLGWRIRWGRGLSREQEKRVFGNLIAPWRLW